MSERCKFDMAYTRCQVDAMPGSRFCEYHSKDVCVSCGAPATRECSYAGQFVCGALLCDDCTGTQGDSTKGLGWGFIGHKHVKKGASDEEVS